MHRRRTVRTGDVRGRTPGPSERRQSVRGRLVRLGLQTPEPRQQAAWLKQYPNITVTVEGNCDERGTREYNLALGERRATSAKNYLVALGVDPNRIQTISYGKERPAVLGSDEAAWAQNRRDVTAIN